MTRHRVKQIGAFTLKALITLIASALGIFGALVYSGRVLGQVDANAADITDLRPRVRDVEREVSGLSGKTDAMHDDVKEIKRFIMGARRKP